MASIGRHDLLNKDENKNSENLNDLFEEIEFLQTKPLNSSTFNKHR